MTRFAASEFRERQARAQAVMEQHDLDALVLTAAPNIRYISGFATQFWESPTRVWLAVLPRQGGALAIVPDIGAAAFASTGWTDIRPYASPAPEDNGVSLLAEALNSLPRRSARVGWELGEEQVVRMPFADFERLQRECTALEFVDAAALIWSLRQIKSAGEIARIRRSCAIACDAFDALAKHSPQPASDAAAARILKAELIARGAETIPYLAVAAGAGGYEQIILDPAGRPLRPGDILFLDVGATVDGYFCDFDRNFAVGPPGEDVVRAQEALWQASEAAIAAARPGVRCADLWRAMADSLEKAGYARPQSGRFGHGLGLQLTEPPSITASESMVLEPGMVMTIEPGLELAPGKLLVHEENIAITDKGADLLTRRAPRRLPVLG